MAESVRDQLLRTRDLALRARRLADGLTSEVDREGLQRHAAELEAQAADLERTLSRLNAQPPVSGGRMQVQQQQQQQQQSEAPQQDPPPEKPEG